MRTLYFLLNSVLATIFLCRVGAKDVEPYNHSPTGALTGEISEWHKITLGWDYTPAGSATNSENDNRDNPFFNYRLDVTFSHSSEDVPSYVVPGFFAADGNAANTGATSGNVWLCHFVPSALGTWTWQASFVRGLNVSVDFTTSGTPVGFDGTQGSFQVLPSNKGGLDLRSKGRLEYVGQSYLQFAGTGEFFFKSGVASADNILASSDFDGAVISTTNTSAKPWLPHQQDYRPSDPTWAGGKGAGLIGALNYLSNVGMNAISVQTLTLLGDDGTISPFAGEALQYYDVSKLAQWQIGQKNDQLLDGGSLGPDRAVYYRELVARFGHHLALTWNLGEDNTNLDEQRKSFIDYISAIDPYQHPIVIHSFAIGKNSTYTPLLNYPSLTGISLQSRAESAGMDALEWVQASTDAGLPWIVCNDEQNPSNIGVLPDSVVIDNHASIRIPFLWGILMAGGAGIEYYFGTSTDESHQDFRSREGMFNQSRYALDFLEYANVPSLNTLSNANNLVSEGTWALSDLFGTTFILYLLRGGSAYLDVSAWAGSAFSVSWYNPRNGGNFTSSTVTSIIAGPANSTSIGEPPNDKSLDWVALLVCDNCVGGDDSESVVRSALPSSAPMMAPFIPLSAIPIVSPATASPETPSITPTSMTPMLAPFIPLSISPVTSMAAEGVPSTAPTSSTPTMAPFVLLSPNPINPAINSATVFRTTPFIPLASTGSPVPGISFMPQATASPTSATPSIAPFIPLSSRPVSSSAQGSAYLSRPTVSPTSAAPVMAPFIPVTGTPAVAPASEAPAMTPFIPLTGNHPAAVPAPSKMVVLSKPVHPQWRLTPLSLLVSTKPPATTSSITQSSRSNSTGGTVESSNLFSTLEERNISNSKKPYRPSELQQREPAPSVLLSSLSSSSPTPNVTQSRSNITATSTMSTSSPTTNFELLWNQVMRAPNTESNSKLTEKVTISPLISRATTATASWIEKRPKQLRQSRKS